MSESVSHVVRLNQVNFHWSKSLKAVIDIPEFSMRRGESVFLQGASGSGKTTLLSLIAAVLQPQSGQVSVDGVELGTLRGGQRDQFRVDRIGLVFQQFNLLPFLSVSENIQLPCRFSKLRRSQAVHAGKSIDEETDRLLSAMHLSPSDIKNRKVTDLSVGQQQRVAVARALIGRPKLIIADEPTSALDSDTRQAFLQLLFSEVHAAGCTLLFVSHDASLGSMFDRSVNLKDINLAANNSDMLGATG